MRFNDDKTKTASPGPAVPAVAPPRAITSKDAASHIEVIVGRNKRKFFIKGVGHIQREEAPKP